MPAKVRPYLFYDTATSICATCLRRVEGKILFVDEHVYLEKWCPSHGKSRVLLADDIEYYRSARETFIKAPEMPLHFNTPLRYGCPYDCGLCPDHMQHSCLTLIEVTEACNLRCPVCYANSGPERKTYRSMAEIEAMLDVTVRNEGEPDVVQISGGEPTLHPQFFEILDAARKRPIRHLMVNTNGVRIANEPDFAARLAEYMPGFELYLQFDGLDDAVHQRLRGANLTRIRRQALERLNEHGISTTLVVTLMKGLNDHTIGETIEYALQQPCVRGVTFQPIQHAGRADGFDPAKDRLTLTEVRRQILKQHNLFKPEDIIPVPCNPDALAMGYALKMKDGPVALTGMIDPAVLLEGGRNTIVFEKDDTVRKEIIRLFATNHSPISQAGSLKELLCCLPKVVMPPKLDYRHVFRILIMQFSDAHSFDTRVVKKSCVHMATPDGKMIPFDTYNLFYRDDLKDKLAQLRASYEPGVMV